MIRLAATGSKRNTTLAAETRTGARKTTRKRPESRQEGQRRREGMRAAGRPSVVGLGQQMVQGERGRHQDEDAAGNQQ